MTVREQLIGMADQRELSPLEAKAARRRTRVSGIIVDAAREQKEAMGQRTANAPGPKRSILARINRGE